MLDTGSDAEMHAPRLTRSLALMESRLCIRLTGNKSPLTVSRSERACDSHESIEGVRASCEGLAPFALTGDLGR